MSCGTEKANGERAPVLVQTARLAPQLLAGNEIGEGAGCLRPARPPANQRALASLPGFGGIDALQPDAHIANRDGIAIDHAGETGDGLALSDREIDMPANKRRPTASANATSP